MKAMNEQELETYLQCVVRNLEDGKRDFLAPGQLITEVCGLNSMLAVEVYDQFSLCLEWLVREGERPRQFGSRLEDRDCRDLIVYLGLINNDMLIIAAIFQQAGLIQINVWPYHVIVHDKAKKIYEVVCKLRLAYYGFNEQVFTSENDSQNEHG